MRILCLANVVPYPLYGGVQLRVFHLLSRIARKHEVILGCHAWDDQDRDNAATLTRKGIRTVTGDVWAPNWKKAWPAARCLLAGDPPEIAMYQSPALHELVRRESFDILQVEETLLAPYASSRTPGSKSKTVLTFHNVHFVQSRRIAEIEEKLWRRLWVRTNAALMRRYEPGLARRFDRSIAVSEPDRGFLQAAAPDVKIDLVPNGVDTSEMAQMPECVPGSQGNPCILFVGTLNYLPCVDAAVVLVREILPLLRARVPNIEVWIVGREATPEVRALAGDGVFVESSVPDVRPYYQRCSVAVVPLRAGGGSRLKILEAMSLGRPVVSTTVGAEGINVRQGENILLADDDRAFADAILNVMLDDILRRALVDSARRLVEEQYDWEAITATQLRIYDEVMAKN